MQIKPIKNGISIIPETEFETYLLADLFIVKNDRKVIVKSGSIDVTVGGKE